MNKKMIKAALLAVAFIASIPLGLLAQDEGYYAGSYARLSYVNGAVYIQRTADLGYEKGEVNLALVQGDKIGTESGRAEIQLGQRNYLRLGDNTKVEFALLPTSGNERITLHLTEGSLYVRVGTLPTDKGIEIDTPDASFYVLEEGLYRVDVRPQGDTRAFVREGSLEAAGEQGSKLVQAQETITASNGQVAGDPGHGNSPADAFDDWNGSRDELLAPRSERQYLPSEMGDYEEELDQNGHWVYERPYGNVWVPDVTSYNDWQPYYYGRWAWYPVIGWTWVPSESWGWSVYHYGRWNWRFGLGWYWIPQNHWGPAWVHWWWDRDYIGWCPLTWYNRPGYLFNDRFYDRWDDRWFSAHNRAMTVVRRDRLQDPDIGRRHIGSAELDRIGRVELRAQQPSIRPTVDNARPQAIAARRALADRPGSRTEVRALASSRSVSSSNLRPGSVDQGFRSGNRGVSPSNDSRGAVARPSLRNDSATARAIRTYPSERVSGSGAATYPSRRNDTAAGGRSNEARVTGSQGTDRGSSRGATVREQPQGTRSPGSDRGGSTAGRGESVKSYPSTTRPVRSGSEASSNSSAGRSQSRTYSSRSSVSSPSSRLSSPSSSSSRSSTSVRSYAPSTSSRSSSSRTPSYTQPRSSYSSGSSAYSTSRPRSYSSSSSRSSGASSRSYSAPRSSGSYSGRSYSAPRSGTSSGRSFSAPRSSGSYSGRSSYSAPRSSGSSGRSYSGSRSSGSSRSGGSSASRSSSSSSKSSGSSSRSSGSHRR
jgi:hypothetical protein